MRKKYETDLTDEQWDVIAPLFSNMRKYKWEERIGQRGVVSGKNRLSMAQFAQ